MRPPSGGRRRLGPLPVAPEAGPGGLPDRRVSLRPLAVRRLGTVSYPDGLALQERLVLERRAGDIPDTLLLLEHPHVITLGSGSDPEHVLAGPDRRADLGIELFETGRGGDVTYHGPGQLVGYPILALEEERRDLHRYLRDLEAALIDALAALGVRGEPSAGMTGVWVGGGKIAAIGVRVSSGWITSHGFALNVSTDLRYFDTIVPCGIADLPVTSLERELDRPAPMAEVETAVCGALASRLGRALVD
ncbi:MAG: lipoyl(octanoyl) transferase LipB [Gemmatimonadetes bacterium]|nr:lipoyl(octanoyl) transferase LipB [Gemmatimonadota bacterium]